MVNKAKVEWGFAAVFASLIITSLGYRALEIVLLPIAFFSAAGIGIIWGIIEIIQGVREKG